ncbi:MAG: LEA type 2 family protein [bacterium]
MKRTMLCVLALMVVGTGCKTPEVNVKSALLKKLTTTRLDVGLNLDVLNPNEYEIPINGVDWKLDLFSSHFNDGAVALTRNIGPQRTTAVEVPLGLTYNAISVGVQGLLTKQNIPWGIDGGVTFKIGGQPLRVGYGSQGAWRNPLFR